MHFLSKTSLSVLLLAITQVQALICYETVILDALTKNVTVIEKEIPSGFCEIIDCRNYWGDPGSPCDERIKTNSSYGPPPPLYMKLEYRQAASTSGNSLNRINYIPHWKCNSDRCNTIEAMFAAKDTLVLALVIGGLVASFVAIVLATIYSTHLTSKILKAIQGLKILNLSISLLLFVLLCLVEIPFGGTIAFNLVFIASILSMGFHAFDFFKRNMEPTKRRIISELVIFALYTAGVSMMIEQIMMWASSSTGWAGKCQFTPSSMTDRKICSFIEPIMGLSTFHSFFCY